MPLTNELHNNLLNTTIAFDNTIRPPIAGSAVTNMTLDERDLTDGFSHNFNFFTAILSAGVYEVGFQTPPSPEIYLILDARLTSDINYIHGELYENVTFTGNPANTIDSNNTNRTVTNPSNVTYYDGFTVAPSIIGATLLDQLVTLGGTGVGGGSSGTEAVQSAALILEQNTKYLMRFTNVTGVPGSTGNVLFRMTTTELGG